MLAAFVELPGDRINVLLTVTTPGAPSGIGEPPCFLECRKAIPQAAGGRKQ
jgi:hypothetical protein